MKIVVLNECFFNKDHLARLKKLGDMKIYNDTKTEEQVIERIKDADIVIADQFIAPLNKKVFESTKKLKFLALNAISYSSVDLNSANKKGITISNIPGFSKQSVAELVIGLMFAVGRNIVIGDKTSREGPIELDPGNNNHKKFIGFDFKGKTLGIIGLGKIGSVVAKLCMALEMKAIAYNRSNKNMKGVEMVSLENLLKNSDVVSITLPSTPETRNLLGRKEIEKMKKDSILISISERSVIDIKAVYEALSSGKIYGAGFDMKVEKNDPLTKLDNVVITPHCGSFTKESFFEILPEMIVNNVESFVKGKPINLVR